jgi:glycosyltransferase involved in cell wall biosynthesis
VRIAQVSTVGSPVAPAHSGSIEGIVWLLTKELVAMGHEVTVFGVAGSTCAGKLVGTLPEPYAGAGAPGDWHVCEMVNLAAALERSEGFDVVHSHAYLWSLPFDSLSCAPMVHTTHVMPGDDGALLRRRYPQACVTALSSYQWALFPDLGPCPLVPNGVDPAMLPFRAAAGDYLCFLGRFIPGKGPVEAVEVARRLGMPLVLAGPRSGYFHTQVEPLVDGHLVRYAGTVTGEGRARLLGGARALLYPVREAEPFGLVPVEAMTCGTPVAAVGLGAVPELVEEGVTGAIAASVEELPAAVARALDLDRGVVRARALERFSGGAMARRYAAVYESVGGGGRR